MLDVWSHATRLDLGGEASLLVPVKVPLLLKGSSSTFPFCSEFTTFNNSGVCVVLYCTSP